MPQLVSEENKQKWMSIVHEQRQSGLSIAEWCRQKDVAVHTFYYWRDKFFPKSQLDRSAFSEITDQKLCPKGITLEYQGIRILLDQHFNPCVLKRCLRVLKEC
jgi:transposase-like protein